MKIIIIIKTKGYIDSKYLHSDCKHTFSDGIAIAHNRCLTHATNTCHPYSPRPIESIRMSLLIYCRNNSSSIPQNHPIVLYNNFH